MNSGGFGRSTGGARIMQDRLARRSSPAGTWKFTARFSAIEWQLA